MLDWLIGIWDVFWYYHGISGATFWPSEEKPVNDYETIRRGDRFYLLDRCTSTLYDNALNEVCPCCLKRVNSKIEDDDYQLLYFHGRISSCLTTRYYVYKLFKLRGW